METGRLPEDEAQRQAKMSTFGFQPCDAGVNDGDWIEVTNLQHPMKSNLDDPWSPVDGPEKGFPGVLSILAEGSPVEVASATGSPKVARPPATSGLAVESLTVSLARSP